MDSPRPFFSSGIAGEANGVPCVPIRVPDSICRRNLVYRILAAGGLREVAAPTAAKSICSEDELGKRVLDHESGL